MTEPMRFELIAGTGLEIIGHQTGGREDEAALLAEAKAFVLGEPCAGASMPTIPMVGEQKIKEADRILGKNTVSDWWYKLAESARDRFSKAHGLFRGISTGNPARGEMDCSGAFLEHLSRRLAAIYARKEIPTPFQNVIQLRICDILVAARFLPGSDAIDAVAAAFRAGCFPLCWSGRWPKGHLIVFATAGQLPDTSVAALKAAAKQAAAQHRDQLVRRHREHMGYAKALTAKDVHRTAWDSLVRQGDAQALAAHFAPLVANNTDRQLLEQVCARLVRLAVYTRRVRLIVPRRDLVVVLRTTEGGLLSLRCAPPWSAAIPRMPADLISILRLHNGMRIDEPGETIALFPFTGKEFDIGKEARRELKQEGILAEEPWSVAPVLIPLTDGQDLFIYDPVKSGAGGKARLLQLSHETGGAEDQDMGTAGGVFLRMLAARLGIPTSSSY